MGSRPLVSLLPLVVMFSGCGSAPVPSQAEPGRGAQLFAEWNCAACHGEAAQGTEFAPPLRALSARWGEDELTAFLADPDAARNARPALREMAARFPAPMPAFTEPEPDRRALASWLLRRDTP